MINKPTSDSSQFYVHGLMMLAIILAASSFPVGALITNELPASVLMFFRFLLASFLFLPFVIRRHGFAFPSVNALWRYAALGVPLAAFFWCMFESLRFTSVVNTGALYTLVPAFTAIAAYFINKEITKFFRIVGLIIGTMGALWVVFRGDINLLLGLHLNYGDLVFILGCISLSLYNPMIKRLHCGEPMMVLTYWVLVSGSVWLFLLSITSFAQIDWSQINNSVYLGTLYLAIFSTQITFFIINFSTLKIGATKVAAYGFLTPFFVIIMSLIMGLDDFNSVLLPGILLILVSMIFIQIDMPDKSNA